MSFLDLGSNDIKYNYWPVQHFIRKDVNPLYFFVLLEKRKGKKVQYGYSRCNWFSFYNRNIPINSGLNGIGIYFLKYTSQSYHISAAS